MRIQAANIPPYDPPNAITGLSAAPELVDFTLASNSAKSARACSDVRYPKYFASYLFTRNRGILYHVILRYFLQNSFCFHMEVTGHSICVQQKLTLPQILLQCPT